MASRLPDLVELASERSSERRRELLRRVTDLFLEREEDMPAADVEVFDAVLLPLVDAVELDVRQELAERFGDAGRAPLALARRLARDSIKVALPILTNSRLLDEQDLLAIARSRSQAHLCAVAARPELSAAVSGAIVHRADDATLQVLIRNEGAEFSRALSEQVADRAATNPALQEAVVGRAAMPLDLVNSLYLVVERRLREQIRARNASADPAVVEAAFKAARERMARQAAEVCPQELQAACAEITALASRRRLTPKLLLDYLRSGQPAHFAAGLAYLAQVQEQTVALVMRRRDLDGLAILCRAVDMDRAFFLSFSAQLLRGGQPVGSVQEWAALYGDVPVEAARRTLRFWRLRCGAELAAAC